MWTGYGLEMIYERQVTAIELLCASPCLTSMVLLSMESKHRQEPRTAVFDEQAHMARHRFGARGNAITFPLPVEALLQQLTAHVEMPDADDVLPRSGKQLCEVFRVVLKTNKTGKTTEEEVKTLIHQARVRRQARGESKRMQKPPLKRGYSIWSLKPFSRADTSMHAYANTSVILLHMYLHACCVPRWPVRSWWT